MAIGGAIWRLPWSSVGDGGMRRSRIVGRLGVRILGTLPFVVGGISEIAGAGGGLYWVAGGIVLAIAGAVVNAWVLLVEILR